MFKKSQGGEAHRAYLGHALTENRHGFVVAATVTYATGTAARGHAWPMAWSTMRRTMARSLDRMKAQYPLAIMGGNLLRWVNLTG